MIDLFVDAMRAADLRCLVSVANGESAGLYFRLKQEPDFTVIDACREGEAVAIATGLHLGGRRAMLSMENFGVYESLDTMRSLPIDYGLPIPVLVGYTARPKPGWIETWDQRYGNIASQARLGGQWTEQVLSALSLPFTILDKADSDADNGARIAEAIAAPGSHFLLTESV